MCRHQIDAFTERERMRVYHYAYLFMLTDVLNNMSKKFRDRAARGDIISVLTCHANDSQVEIVSRSDGLECETYPTF